MAGEVKTLTGAKAPVKQRVFICSGAIARTLDCYSKSYVSKN
jgi:hypothetical protein